MLWLDLMQLPQPKQGMSSREMEGRFPVTFCIFG